MYAENVFDLVPYRLLVRRVRSGDCDKIGELYAVVEPDLTAFCHSLTGDDASARRAADKAFVYAAELLASQSVTVAGFRSTLLVEAKGSCYNEIGRAALSDVTGDQPDDRDRIDIEQLRTRLEDLRPEALSSPEARITWRSRLAPSTAITVVLLMVVMIEMAALGLDLIPLNPGRDGSRTAAAEKSELSPIAQSTATQNTRTQVDTADNDDGDEVAKSKKSPRADLPADTDSRTEPPASRPGGDAVDGSLIRDDNLPQLPPVNQAPELPLPEVPVPVDPLDPRITLPGDSRSLPPTPICVGSTCVSAP